MDSTSFETKVRMYSYDSIITAIAIVAIICISLFMFYKKRNKK